MRSKALLALLFVSLLFPSIVRSQEPAEANESCDTDFAIFLANQQMSDAGTVREPAKRIRILILGADFIWPYDQPASRGYFTEAFKLSVDHFREKGFESTRVGNEKGSVSVPKPDYRFEVIRAIAKRDSVWARKLSDEIMAEFEKAVKDRKPGSETAEIDSLLNIAVMSLESDPNLSWYLFRKVMQYPLDRHWYFTLYSIAAKDPSFAETLYRELLPRYRNETPRRLLFLSAFPFSRNKIFGPDQMQYGAPIPGELRSNPELQQAFLNVFLDRIGTFASNPQDRMNPPEQFRLPEPVYMISALAEFEPIVVAEIPNMIQRLSAARAQATSLLTDEMRSTLQTRERQNSGSQLSFDERIERLEKADEEGKLNDAMIVNLIFGTSRTEGQYAKVEPWLDKIKDENVRRETTAYFWFVRSQLAIKESRFRDAETYAAKVPEIDHRSILAFELAEAQLKSINDTASAYQTLNEVAKLVRLTDNSATKAKILLGLATQYEKINLGFAIEELAEAVRVLNRTKDPDMSSMSVFRQIIGKDFASYAVYSVPGYDIEGTFRRIGERDFGLTLSNARALDDKFLRTIAVLSTAKHCLDKPRTKKTVRPSAN